MKDTFDLRISKQENERENTQLVLEELTPEEAEKIVGGNKNRLGRLKLVGLDVIRPGHCGMDYWDWPPCPN